MPRRPAIDRAATAALLLPAWVACAGDVEGPFAGTPAGITFVGAAPTAPAALPLPVTVVVTDATGAPVGGIGVEFRVLAGGGWLAAGSDVTDAAGRADAAWYPGPEPGAVNRLEARTPNGRTGTLETVAAALENGRAHHGARGFIEYVPGDLPVILAAPHGGTLRPTDLPDRTAGTATVDLNTVPLARAVSDALFERTGRRPHLIVCLLHRTKLDANREVAEAAQGDQAAGLAWREFHAFVEAARHAVEGSAGRGLFIDLHGHGHPLARVELGYLLDGAQLALPDAALDALAAGTSVREIVERTGTPLSDLVRGPASLGALLHAAGFPAVPSPPEPDPLGHPFFSGGYSTERHGSRAGGTISGVQVELPFPGVRDTPTSRTAFARAFAAAIDAYFAGHFDGPLGPGAPFNGRRPGGVRHDGADVPEAVNRR